MGKLDFIKTNVTLWLKRGDMEGGAEGVVERVGYAQKKRFTCNVTLPMLADVTKCY
jgi:hypothetical protein